MKIKKDQNTEQAIIEAAEKLFLEKGFTLTTTTEIAKEAGCNQALVHYYFRTKEKLFDSIFENKAKLLVSSMIQAGEKNQSFEEKIRQKVEIHFDLIRANPKLPLFLFSELYTNPKRLQSIKKKVEQLPKDIIQQFERELQEEIDKGNIRQLSVIDFVLTMVSLNVMLFIIKPILV